jgi:hypothetical protein
MVKIEIITPGAAVTVLRNGERVQVIEKQYINYNEIDTIEVTGGEVTYSIDEMEVVTKSGNAAPAVPQTPEEPKLSAKEIAKAALKAQQEAAEQEPKESAE